MFLAIKKLFSLLTGRPIFISNGFTTTDEKIKEEPDTADPENLVFYRLKKDLGSFEIREIKHKKDGRVSYVVFNSEDDLEFEITKKWFEYFFEEFINSPCITFKNCSED